MKKFIKNILGHQNIMKKRLEKNFKETTKKDIHNPETDAINLMMLYEAFLKNKKILKEEYTKVIQKYTSFPAPIAKTLSKLYKEGKVTIDDFNEFIEDEL